MDPLNNRVLEKLRRGETALVASTTPVGSPKIAELIGLCGFDCLWIDMEHQDYSWDDAWAMSLACRSTGMAPMIRVRREGRHSLPRAFEAGALGAMVPHCMGGADAREIVRDGKFAPVGLRGIDGVEAAARYGMMPTARYMDWANRETFLCVQIEDHEAVDEIDEIAATPGVDILFVGPADLSQSYGCFGQPGHPSMKRAFEAVAAAAARHGQWWGSTSATPERARELMDMGARFLTTVSAIGLLRKGFQETYAAWDALRC